MDRSEAARIFRDVVIYRNRSDVPADVAEAMDTALRLIGAGDFGECPTASGRAIAPLSGDFDGHRPAAGVRQGRR